VTTPREGGAPARIAYDLLLGLMKMGKSIDAAAADLLMLNVERDAVDEALLRVRARAQEARILKLPASLIDPSQVGEAWYPGPSAGDVFWPALADAFVQQPLEPTAIESIDAASTKVVSLLAAPWTDPLRTRGLVLGFVQSGKTSNFMAVMAKAADAGYRMFVVLSGLHNGLRRQTQVRMENQLIGSNTNLWISLTGSEGDFGNPPNPDALLTAEDRRLLAVVKKNKMRLGRLVSWLQSAHPDTLRSCPILVIDDEADQASVNTARELDQRTEINRLILELLSVPRAAYVGYTATPFANVFVDPEVPHDLYPRHFIVDLPCPADYFGSDRLFGRELLEHEEDEPDDGLDMIRRIDPGELHALQPGSGAARHAFRPEITTSIEEAFRWFVLATAARRARGQHGHSTMLVHTTHYTDIHDRYRQPIEGLRDALKLSLVSGGPVVGELHEQWAREQAAVRPAEFEHPALEFADIEPWLISVLDALRVVVDNYRSVDRLAYGDDPQVVVVIGGNTLSRGLTLEGLVVSYFLRSATTYDTLLQMGRWFGYRHGYEDLPRVWMTEQLEEWFRHLATVEAEIRIDVKQYESQGVTPETYATRIRTHPQLAITAALKLRHAEPVRVGYANRRLQTILFQHRDKEWLDGNIEASRMLVTTALRTVGEPEALGGGRWLFRNVGVSAVAEFLRTYEFHPNAQELKRDLLLRYIDEQNAYDDLLSWNAAIMGAAGDGLGEIDLGLAEPVGMIGRAPLRSSKPYADIKALMSRPDRVVDLGLSADDLRQKDETLQALRPFGTGLLLLYPISRNSPPRESESRARVPMEAIQDVMGVGLVFPDVPPSRQWASVDYMAVILPEAVVEEDETGDLSEAMETDDEDDHQLAANTG
jgi:hypothetical protein